MPQNHSIYVENPRAIVSACHEAQQDGREVSDDVARAIAGQWHDGQATAFYSFASTGHYDRDALLAELSGTIADAYDAPGRATADARLMLDMLGTYLINRR